MKHTMSILIVEDNPVNIDILVEILKEQYRLYVAIDGASAKKMLRTQRIDLVLLDLYLPDAKGASLLKELKADPRYAKYEVIVITDDYSFDVRTDCFKEGALDYITKPYNKYEIVERIKNHVRLIEANRLLENKQELLEELIQIQVDEIKKTRDAAVKAVSSLVETRDSATGDHINRTQRFVMILAEKLRECKHYIEELSDEYIEELVRASALHDIGKIGIPDKVLLKPEQLTEEEFEIIMEHPKIGYEALRSAGVELGENIFFSIACDISLYHHEKWDGSGYPKGLKGEEIPLSARIMALADVYDALTTKRPYKNALPHPEAVAIILNGKGRHFDPKIVEAFQKTNNLFSKVSYQMSH